MESQVGIDLHEVSEHNSDISKQLATGSVSAALGMDAAQGTAMESAVQAYFTGNQIDDLDSSELVDPSRIASRTAVSGDDVVVVAADDHSPRVVTSPNSGRSATEAAVVVWTPRTSSARAQPFLLCTPPAKHKAERWGAREETPPKWWNQRALLSADMLAYHATLQSPPACWQASSTSAASATPALTPELCGDLEWAASPIGSSMAPLFQYGAQSWASVPPWHGSSCSRITQPEADERSAHFSFILRKADEANLGLEVLWDTGAWLVNSVISGGAVESWNKLCIDGREWKAVRPGDWIVSINNIQNSPRRMLVEAQSKKLLKLEVARGAGVWEWSQVEDTGPISHASSQVREGHLAMQPLQTTPRKEIPNSLEVDSEGSPHDQAIGNVCELQPSHLSFYV